MASLAPPPDGNVTRAYVVAVPTIVTTAIAAILTIVRLYVRIRILNGLEWDDYFNAAAMVTVFVVLGLTLGATANGLGRHFFFVDKAEAAFSVELLRISEFFLIISTVLIKISISLFLKRLFLTSRRWRIFLWTFIAFNTLTSLLDAAIIFPQCSPVELNWDHSVKGHCWSNTAINATGIAQGSIAAATDFILATLPIFFLWKINIKWRTKLAISGVMAMGFASGGFALARTVLVPSLTTTHDPTWDLVDLFMWAVLEATFGVIAAAAPTVRTLFGHNAVSASYQVSKPSSIPLQTARKNGYASRAARRSWYHGAADIETGFENLKDITDESGGRTSDSGESRVKLWAHPGGGIVKTTDVRVHSDSRPGEAEASRIPGEATPESEAHYIGAGQAL